MVVVMLLLLLASEEKPLLRCNRPMGPMCLKHVCFNSTGSLFMLVSMLCTIIQIGLRNYRHALKHTFTPAMCMPFHHVNMFHTGGTGVSRSGPNLLHVWSGLPNNGEVLSGLASFEVLSGSLKVKVAPLSFIGAGAAAGGTSGVSEIRPSSSRVLRRGNEVTSSTGVPPFLRKACQAN